MTWQRCILPDVAVPVAWGARETVGLKPGDYVLVRIESAHGQTLQGEPLSRSSIVEASSATLSPELVFASQ